MQNTSSPGLSSRSPYTVQAVDRALCILTAFKHGSEQLGVVELSQRVGLHRATVHRLLANLEQWNLVEQDRRTSKYRLGFRLFELGSMVVDAFDVKKVAYPQLIELAARSGETAHLVVLDGPDVVFIEKVESTNVFRMVSRVGRRLPAYSSAAGKCLLADLPSSDLNALLSGTQFIRLTDKSVSNLGQLEAVLAQVREQGYGVDDEETQVGLRCVGTLVRDHSGKGVAAVSISGPVARVTKNRVPAVARMVRDAATTISRELGYRVTAAT